MAVPLRRGPRTRRRRVQRRPPRRGGDGPLPGRRGGAAGSAGLRRPGHRVGARPAPRARRLGRASRAEGEIATGATALLVAGLDDPPRGHRRHALRRRAAPARALPASPRPSRRARCSRRYDPARGAPVPGEYSKYYTARRTGRSRGCTARSRARGGARPPTASAPTWRHARRGRGPLAADRRPLGRLRPGRDGAFPSAAAAAHRGRAGLRAPAGRAVRRPGPLGRAAVRAVGRRRARRPVPAAAATA